MVKLLDHYLIRVPSVWDVESSSGIQKMNPAYYIDKERDRYERKLLCGFIESTPIAFREIPYMPIDPGLPPPRAFIGHDVIERMRQQGYNWCNKEYHPGANDLGFKMLTIADFGRLITAKRGDLVYFHPAVTEAENQMGEELFRASPDQIIWCNGIAQGGYIIIKPLPEETEIAGVVISQDPIDRELEGTVAFSREGFLNASTPVYFERDSNWEFWIEGERYYVMLEENVVLTAEAEPV